MLLQILKIKPKGFDFIKNSTYQGLLKDGESKNSKITITAILDKNINVPLSKKDISHNLYFISDLAKIGLKESILFSSEKRICKTRRCFT